MKITDLLREQLPKEAKLLEKEAAENKSESKSNSRLILASLLEKTADILEKHD